MAESPGPGWTRVPMTARNDLRHGGRWTSWAAGGHEWLWQHPDRAVRAARAAAAPGDAFVDAGGAEECFPTVRGVPDHGDAWSRGWQRNDTVSWDQWELHRDVGAFDQNVKIDYRLRGPAGGTFVHALHALLDLSPQARVVLPGVTTVTVLDEPSPGQVQERPWPSGLDMLGPYDGTAVCALAPDCREAVVIDGEHALGLSWSSDTDPSACSLLLWRNLGGWPEDGPYRSIGIEPMVGRTADWGDTSAGPPARLDPTGTFRWALTVSGWRRD